MYIVPYLSHNLTISNIAEQKCMRVKREKQKKQKQI